MGNIYAQIKPKKGSAIYQYIMTREDLGDALLDGQEDLSYRLMKESKRQRYLIANSKAMKELNEKIQETVYNEIIKVFISADGFIVENINNALNQISAVTSNIGIKFKEVKPQSNTFLTRFATMLGKSLGNSISYIVKDTLGL